MLFSRLYHLMILMWDKDKIFPDLGDAQVWIPLSKSERKNDHERWFWSGVKVELVQREGISGIRLLSWSAVINLGEPHPPFSPPPHPPNPPLSSPTVNDYKYLFGDVVL